MKSRNEDPAGAIAEAPIEQRRMVGRIYSLANVEAGRRRYRAARSRASINVGDSVKAKCVQDK